MAGINKVLLVDDDEITNILHTRVIRKSGLVSEVLVARDGRQALDILSDHLRRDHPLPELILLDINMPGMGGFEFLETYKHRKLSFAGQMIIVMLSTSLLKVDHARAEADPNVHSFSEKPITLAAFAALVETYVARRAQITGA